MKLLVMLFVYLFIVLERQLVTQSVSLGHCWAFVGADVEPEVNGVGNFVA